MAMPMAHTATMRPMRTPDVPSSVASPNMGATSTVKIVEMLLHIDAREETIAANRAAKTKPLIPTGRRVMAEGYA